jgi:hypothetical protein
VLQDVIGVAFMISAISSLKLPNLKLATIFLAALLLCAVISTTHQIVILQMRHLFSLRLSHAFECADLATSTSWDVTIGPNCDFVDAPPLFPL